MNVIQQLHVRRDTRCIIPLPFKVCSYYYYATSKINESLTRSPFIRLSVSLIWQRHSSSNVIWWNFHIVWRKTSFASIPRHEITNISPTFDPWGILMAKFEYNIQTPFPYRQQNNIYIWYRYVNVGCEKF